MHASDEHNLELRGFFVFLDLPKESAAASITRLGELGIDLKVVTGSVTVAAAFLPFLPMLPFQILLNNLLYDTSQLAIPTDRVDVEQLTRPSHWDIAFIRRFMVRFGPISSPRGRC